jgi:PBP1b-binding outer membrane lipoprotein LpoB
MARYIVLLAALAILLSGCVVVHSEKHVAASVNADPAASAALP